MVNHDPFMSTTLTSLLGDTKLHVIPSRGHFSQADPSVEVLYQVKDQYKIDPHKTMYNHHGKLPFDAWVLLWLRIDLTNNHFGSVKCLPRGTQQLTLSKIVLLQESVSPSGQAVYSPSKSRSAGR